jgi:hypothetical protein
MRTFTEAERAVLVQLFALLDVLTDLALAGVPLRAERARQILDQAAGCRRILLPPVSAPAEDETAPVSVH